MFVTVSAYRAKAGEEDAIIALHEDWQRHQQPPARGYLSGELLRNVMDSREFMVRESRGRTGTHKRPGAEGLVSARR